MDKHADFLALFLRHQDELRAFVRAVLRDPARREDALQEAALVLWREIDRYDPARPFGPWARGVAAKVVLKRLERDRRELVLLSPEAIAALADADVTAALQIDGSQREEALRGCVEKLPAKARRLLHLRYVEALTLAEMARQLGGSLDAVHKALTRLREALGRCIEKQLSPARPAR